MPPLLLSYHKLDPPVSYRYDSIHRLVFTHHTLWEAAEHFQRYASDPSMDRIAFVFKNRYNKTVLVSSYPRSRELVFINDVLYLRLCKEEIDKIKRSCDKQQSHGLVDDFGRLVFILRHIGTSIVYRYKANQIIRSHILKY